jgi:hypothetical protein
MPSIGAVAGQVRQSDYPILILDTCIFLDIIRSTHRGLKDYAEHARHLLRLVTAAPPSCGLVVASIVPDEWNRHAQKVTDEVNDHYAAMEAQSSGFHDACQVLGIPLSFGRASYRAAGAAEGLRDLSKQLLGHALRLDAEPQTMSGAYNRAVRNIPPSRKGGQIQDCTITEEALALCRKLAGSGFARKRVFCTSNVTDYCEPGKKIHPALAVEFNSVGLVFTTNLGWAVHEVTH